METKSIIKITALTIGALMAFCISDLSAYQMLFGNSPIVSNYPNPFDSRNSDTTIVYSIANQANVRMKIYDLFGNMVREYPEMVNVTGLNKVVWDGTNEIGQKVAKGGYICLIEVYYGSKPIVITRKIGVIH